MIGRKLKDDYVNKSEGNTIRKPNYFINCVKAFFVVVDSFGTIGEVLLMKFYTGIIFHFSEQEVESNRRNSLYYYRRF